MYVCMYVVKLWISVSLVDKNQYLVVNSIKNYRPKPVERLLNMMSELSGVDCFAPASGKSGAPAVANTVPLISVMLMSIVAAQAMRI